jgi:hypothetical protein
MVAEPNSTDYNCRRDSLIADKGGINAPHVWTVV